MRGMITVVFLCFVYGNIVQTQEKKFIYDKQHNVITTYNNHTVTSYTTDQLEALVSALRTTDTKTVLSLLEKKVDPNIIYCSPHGKRVLLDICSTDTKHNQSAQTTILKNLLDHDLNSDRAHLLLYTIAIQRNDLATMLLAHKADPNRILIKDGGTTFSPLKDAVLRNSNNMVALLLEHKADPNQKVSISKAQSTVPLWLFVSDRTRNSSILHLLVRYKADITTPIHHIHNGPMPLFCTLSENINETTFLDTLHNAGVSTVMLLSSYWNTPLPPEINRNEFHAWLLKRTAKLANSEQQENDAIAQEITKTYSLINATLKDTLPTMVLNIIGEYTLTQSRHNTLEEIIDDSVLKEAIKKSTKLPSMLSLHSQHWLGRGFLEKTCASNPLKTQLNRYVEGCLAKEVTRNNIHNATTLMTHHTIAPEILIHHVVNSIENDNLEMAEQLWHQLKQQNNNVSANMAAQQHLFKAIGCNNDDVVSWLITHNVDVDTQSALGQTPLITAIVAGHENMVKVLMSLNANKNMATRSNTTALAESTRLQNSSPAHERIYAMLRDVSLSTQQ